MEKYITGTGQSIVVHNKEDCTGNCCLHNPSDHHMKDWPLHWRDDRCFFERIDSMGCGHPDPDEIEYHKKRDQDISLHGCTGMCSPDYFKRK